MKASVIISTFLLFCSVSFGQVNRYTETPTPATYNPMSFDEMYNMAQLNAQANKIRSEQFNLYQSKAQESFNNKKFNAAVEYCNAALSTNLENNHVYYLRGMSYLKIGLKKDGKKDLKKSAKKGNVNAKLALQSLKSNKF